MVIWKEHLIVPYIDFIPDTKNVDLESKLFASFCKQTLSQMHISGQDKIDRQQNRQD